MVRFDVVNFANFQRELFATETTIVLDITVRMFSEFMLNCNCDRFKLLLANITRNDGAVS